MVAKTLLLGASLLTRGAFAAFGLTTTSSSYVVDAGSTNALVVTFSRTNCDITSIKFRGTELQYPSMGSHIGSGLGSGTNVAAQVIGDKVKITCTTSTLTHYYVMVSGHQSVYMATHTTANPSNGELRFIARLSQSELPNEIPFGEASTTAGGSAIEGSDVYLVNGQTRSKFYSSERFIDDHIHCVGSGSMHACMIIPQYETSSGGPFFRDINTNRGGSYTTLYWYMNSGHVQTEPWRVGLHGPYVLSFSRSGIPTSNVDLSWMGDLGLKGWVGTSGRGYVKGKASGVATSFERVVHWFNGEAQYWAKCSSDNNYYSPAMKPGTYTMNFYQGEYKVATSSVTIAAGQTVTKNINSAESARNTIWKIGEWDGKPSGFRNADKQLRMHPSDSRMESWGLLTYTVGSSSLNSVPMAIFKGVNNGFTIKFNLASVPSAAVTLRIGTTLSFSGGRPQATINGWTAAAPSAPSKIDSRGVTRGAYRGHGEIYNVSIAPSRLVAGTNTIIINVISGSGEATGFLSANVILDCIELFQ